MGWVVDEQLLFSPDTVANLTGHGLRFQHGATAVVADRNHTNTTRPKAATEGRRRRLS